MTDQTLTKIEQLHAQERAAADARDDAYDSLRPVELAHRAARRALLIEAARALLDGADRESVFRTAGIDWSSVNACAMFSHELGEVLEAWIAEGHPFIREPLWIAPAERERR